MDILYVGTLPPHPGGSAMVGEQFLAGLAAQVDVEVTRYPMPRFVVHGNQIEPDYLAAR